MNGLTEEQLMQMGATKVQPQSQPQGDMGGGLTEEQLMQMGAQPTGDFGSTNIGGREKKFKSSADRSSYDAQGKIIDTLNNDFSQFSELGDSRFANTVEKTLRVPEQIGVGLGKSAGQLVDFGVTGANELLGVTDNPAFKFGTATRRARQEDLWRGSNPLQKVGTTLGDILQIVLSGGIEGGVKYGATKLPFIAELSKGGKAAQFAAKYLPQAAGNVAQGTALTGTFGQELRPENIALDAVLPVGLDYAGSAFKTGMKWLAPNTKLGKRYAQETFEKLRDNPEVLDSYLKDQIDVLKNAEELKPVKQFSDKFEQEHGQDVFDFAVRSGLFKNVKALTENGQYTTKAVGDHADAIANDIFNDLISKTSSYTGNRYSYDDLMREVLQKVDSNVSDLNIKQEVRDKAMGVVNRTLKERGVLRRTPEGLIPTRPVTDEDILKAFYGVKYPGKPGTVAEGALAKALETVKALGKEKLSTNKDVEQLLGLYKKYKDTAKMFNGLNGSKGQGRLSKRLTGALGGILLAGGNFNPVLYAAGHYAGEKGSNLVDNALTNFKFGNTKVNELANSNSPEYKLMKQVNEGIMEKRGSYKGTDIEQIRQELSSKREARRFLQKKTRNQSLFEKNRARNIQQMEQEASYQSGERLPYISPEMQSYSKKVIDSVYKQAKELNPDVKPSVTIREGLAKLDDRMAELEGIQKSFKPGEEGTEEYQNLIENMQSITEAKSLLEKALLQEGTHPLDVVKTKKPLFSKVKKQKLPVIK